MILAISDIHLGSPISQVELTLEILKEEEYDTLIICGDLLDSYNLHRLSKKHWQLLSMLRKISKHKKCIFVCGNHDRDVETITTLLGFEFVDNYVETVNHKVILFTHGHGWDTVIKDHAILTEIASGAYYVLQKVDRKQWLTRRLKKWVKTWHDAADHLMKNVADFCGKNQYDAVCFGHSHIAKIEIIDGIECVNIGSQCDLPVTYAIIDDGGKIHLKSKEC